MPSSRRGFIKTALLGASAGMAGCAKGRNAPSLSPFDRFRDKFDGIAIAKGDAQYEAWRRGVVWQMDVPDRHPDLIVRPRTVEAAAHAIAYAGEAGMRVCVKSGGHNVSGAFMRGDGMLLDLGEFASVRILKGAPEAWVGPAVWSWNLAKAIEPRGFSFPYAHCATVPMGGYLLGGGVGINGDAWGGLACHSVEAVRVMLGSGDILIADRENNADVFWAARGAGLGFFGAVIDFKIKLRPRADSIMEQIVLYPIDAAAEVAGWLERIATDCPKNIELMMLLANRPPPLAGSTKREQKMCLARLAAFGAEGESAADIMASVARHTPPSGSLFPASTNPSSMDDVLIGSVDPRLGLGFGRYSVETIWTNDLAAAIAPLIAPFVDAPSPKSHILATPRHGAAITDDAAFSSIGRSFLGVYTVWDAETEDDSNTRSTHELAALMSPFAAGRYINEVDGFAFPEKVRDCYSEAAFERLATLRGQFDERGVFQDFPGN